MKITNAELASIAASLEYLNNQSTEAWYEIGKNIKLVTAPLNELNEAKQELFKKYADKNEDGTFKFLDAAKTQIDLGGNLEKANNKWQQIQSDTVDIEFVKFNKSILTGIKLSPKEVTPLIDIIIVD